MALGAMLRCHVRYSMSTRDTISLYNPFLWSSLKFAMELYICKMQISNKQLLALVLLIGLSQITHRSISRDDSVHIVDLPNSPSVECRRVSSCFWLVTRHHVWLSCIYIYIYIYWPDQRVCSTSIKLSQLRSGKRF